MPWNPMPPGSAQLLTDMPPRSCGEHERMRRGSGSQAGAQSHSWARKGSGEAQLLRCQSDGDTRDRAGRRSLQAALA